MPILGTIASQITGKLNTWQPTSAYDALGTIIVPSGGLTSITFAGLPQSGYSHLQVRIFARTNRASTRDGIKLRLNSDNGTNYAQHNVFADGSTISATGYPSEPEMALDSVSAATASANMFGSIVVDILDYANANKTTTVRSFGGNDGNGDGKINFTSNLWNNTAAVNTLYFAPYTGTSFNQYSSFALYGVK
jgi:hypothetical protein